ncbi:unnamed protein product [Ilex paraguariensis]|uniref:SAM dependent carboxyl methyltransferase n=1 Tax=Ilex paraguariensis TaxID=185542 RepID=A0ABC8UNL4_9AQUA
MVVKSVLHMNAGIKGDTSYGNNSKNDFNSVFKSLPPFYNKLKREKGEDDDQLAPCFVSGVPGSFNGSLHWLSQVPEGLENNKGNIYNAKTSPLDVFEAYSKQFQRDFSRSIVDPTWDDCCFVWELLTKSPLDMVPEGLVQEEDIDSFNMPFYTPYKDEVKDIIEGEGSFTLDKLEVFEDKHKTFGNDYIGRIVAKSIRAVVVPMFSSHFGDSIIDNLFERFGECVDEELDVEKAKYFDIVIALEKR